MSVDEGSLYRGRFPDIFRTRQDINSGLQKRKKKNHENESPKKRHNPDPVIHENETPKKRHNPDPVIHDTLLNVDDMNLFMAAFDNQSLPDIPPHPDQSSRIVALEEQIVALERTVYSLATVVMALSQKTCQSDPVQFSVRSDTLIQAASKLISQSK
jgi:hypothetical protein